jgi:hypothetical protein
VQLQGQNFTLLNTMIDPTFNSSLLPEDVSPWINLRGGAIYTPEGLGGKCFNRSVLYFDNTCVPSAQNNYCFEYVPLFNFTWFAVGAMACVGGYPDANAISLNNSIPPPGQLAVTLSNQCGLSSFAPTVNKTSITMATIIDDQGNRFALQSSLQDFNNTKDWQDFVGSSVLPDGWTHEFVNVTTKEYHLPYIVGYNCFITLAMDHLGNQYHLFDYKTPLEEGILSKTQCTVINNPKGADGYNADSAPSPSSGPSPPATPSSAGMSVVKGSSLVSVSLLMSAVAILI